MNDGGNNADRPDVEAIVAGIRRDLVKSGAVGGPHITGNANGSDAGLHDNLAALNENCVVGAVRGGGPLGLVRKVIHKLLGALIGDINGVNARMVRVLNSMLKLIEDGDSPDASEVMASSRRKARMLDNLGRRLDDYEGMRIEERLRRLEEAVERQKGRDGV
ncbi:MAG: hypothetical protein C0404_05050 [Verrucomicrobia bacterium]|nr:hypothetical protein [Verrucomicrobiota bacterium]